MILVEVCCFKLLACVGKIQCDHFDSDPRFPPFLLYVGGNLGSLLNGDVSVMAFKHKETGIQGF